MIPSSSCRPSEGNTCRVSVGTNSASVPTAGNGFKKGMSVTVIADHRPKSNKSPSLQFSRLQRSRNQRKRDLSQKGRIHQKRLNTQGSFCKNEGGMTSHHTSTPHTFGTVLSFVFEKSDAEKSGSWSQGSGRELAG